MTDAEEIILSSQDLLFSLCRKFRVPDEEREDIVQDVLLKILKNLNSWRQEASVKTWIYRIAQNTIIDQQRKKAAK